MKLTAWKSDQRDGEKQDQASLDANTTFGLKLYGSINSPRCKQVDPQFLSLATSSILTEIPCGLGHPEKRWGQWAQGSGEQNSSKGCGRGEHLATHLVLGKRQEKAQAEGADGLFGIISLDSSKCWLFRV